MLSREYPILEFDPDRNALIRPENNIQPIDLPERCVLCFFAEAIEKLLELYPHKIVARFNAESFKPPIYVLDYHGQGIALIQAGVGAPIAAGQIEELYALGCRKFLACGSCGVLERDIAVGHLIIPVSAVRDEGTSYHYAEPAREIGMDAAAAEKIASALRARDIPYIRGKTWTTDAFYRETPAKIKQRKSEGCVTVEMEASAYMAAARYLGAMFGQILYAGDNLGGEVWDSRGYASRGEVRAFLLRVAVETCLTF